MRINVEKTIADGVSKDEILDVLEYLLNMLEYNGSPYLEDAINRATYSGITLMP